MRFNDLEAKLQGYRELPPLWLITGQEELLMIEAADLIRKKAISLGYTERDILNASSTWDWGRLQESCCSMSLFGDRKVIELRLATLKVGTKGSQALQSLAASDIQDAVLICTAPYDWSIKNAAWYKHLLAEAEVVDCAQVGSKELPGWFSRRFEKQNQTAEREALVLLSEKCEGNLLAAKQELLKLHYALGDGARITAQHVRDGVGDVSRFDAESLLAEISEGNAAKAAKVIESLKAEGIAIPSFLWALTDEIRTAWLLCSARENGEQLVAAAQRLRVFPPTKKTRTIAIARRKRSVHLETAMTLVQHIDMLSKGLAVPTRSSDAWSELTSLAVFLAK